MSSTTHSLVVVNVHNERLGSDFEIVKSTLAPLIARAVADPTRFSLLLCGDVNIPKQSVDHIVQSHNSHDLRFGGKKWLRLLSPLLEIHQDEPTRVSLTSSSCIDRLWVSIPSWCLPHTRIISATLWSPLSRPGLSDHAPLSSCFHNGPLRSSGTPPIPKWFATSDMFRRNLDDLLLIRQCNTLPPLPRLRFISSAYGVPLK